MYIFIILYVCICITNTTSVMLFLLKIDNKYITILNVLYFCHLTAKSEIISLKCVYWHDQAELYIMGDNSWSINMQCQRTWHDQSTQLASPQTRPTWPPFYVHCKLCKNDTLFQLAKSRDRIKSDMCKNGVLWVRALRCHQRNANDDGQTLKCSVCCTLSNKPRNKHFSALMRSLFVRLF